MSANIITVGREYGSGGRDIAKRIATQLAIPYYDNELITLAAKNSGINEEIFESHDESSPITSFLGATTLVTPQAFSAPVGFQLSLNQKVFLAQFETITQIAKQGPCVIVGRCADYVLREFSNVYHVFFYASLTERVNRIQRLYGLTETEAKETIRKEDKKRKTYYNFFAEGNWGVRSNYDAVIRTDHCDFDALAASVISLANNRIMP